MSATKPIVTQRETPNFTRGRKGHVIDQIVLHVTEGNAASVYSWFASAKSKVSAGYMVKMSGDTDQFVDDANAAWAQGRVDHPTAPLVVERPGVNPNLYSIGIEHEGSGKTPMTPAQLDASLALTAYLCRTYDIPMDRRHIVGHHEIYSLKSCPGAIDVNDYVRRLVLRNFSPVPEAPSPEAMPLLTPGGTPRPPFIVYSPSLHDWLLVVCVRSDHDWSFVTWKDALKGTVLYRQAAGTPLSKMPLSMH